MKKNTNTAKKNINEITEQLKTGVKDIMESERYREYLDFMGKFTDYSFNNTVLIFLQKPDATLVAGYKSWQQKGRQVRKGEKGIKIIAPSRYEREEITTKDGEQTIMKIPYYTFHAVTVFDISQTEGEDIPSDPVKLLSGNVDGYDELIKRLESVSPVPVLYESFDSEANGYYSNSLKQIVVKTGLSELQTVKTLTHEIAHATLHTDGDKTDRGTKEVQAESVAYTVCSMLGLDASDYSFGYIAGWSSGKELKELAESMDVIRSIAKQIVTKIEQAIV